MSFSYDAITLGAGRPSRSMTGVLMKRGNLTREHARGEHHAREGGDLGHESARDGMPETVGKARKALDGSPPAAFGRNQPCGRADLRLPASATARHSISVVGNTTRWVFVCYGISSTQIDILLNRELLFILALT